MLLTYALQGVLNPSQKWSSLQQITYLVHPRRKFLIKLWRSQNHVSSALKVEIYNREQI